MKNELSLWKQAPSEEVWKSHNNGRHISRRKTIASGITVNPQFYFSIWVLILLNSRVQSCPMVGCALDKCSSSAGVSVCSGCTAGYYKLETKQECNVCASQCTTCSSWTVCQSCQQGYYLDLSNSVCVACSANCDICTSRTACTRCSTGFMLSSKNESCVSSNTDENSDKKEESNSSSVGPIIGYVVSGLVLVVCCTITIIHQRRKQQQESKAKEDFKAEMDRKNQIVPIAGQDSHAINSANGLTGSPARTKIITQKPAKIQMGWDIQEGDDVRRSDERNLIQEPQPAVSTSIQHNSSPEKMAFLSRGQRPSGAEHIGHLSAPQPQLFLKLNSPMISATVSTPKSSFGGGSTAKNSIQKETPLMKPKPKPSGFGGFSKGLISQGASSNSIVGGNTSPTKTKIFNLPGTQSPEKQEGGFTSNLSRIERIEQRVS